MARKDPSWVRQRIQRQIYKYGEEPILVIERRIYAIPVSKRRRVAGRRRKNVAK